MHFHVNKFFTNVKKNFDLPIRNVEIVDSEISLVFSSDRSIGLDFCCFLAFLLAAISF